MTDEKTLPDGPRKLTCGVTWMTLTGHLPGGALGDEITPYAYSVTGLKPPFTLSISGGSLPSGLSLSTGGEVTGQFTEAAQGGTAFSWTVRANDAVGNVVDLDDSCIVSGMVVSGVIPYGWVDATGEYQYAVDGGVGGITYAVSSGALPPGASMSESGLVTYDYTQSGAYSFVVRVTDGAGNTAELPQSVVVYEAIATFDPASLNGSTNTLSNGNLTVTGHGTHTSVYAAITTRSRGSGKLYWEITVSNGITTQPRFSTGVTSRNAAYTAANQLGFYGSSYGPIAGISGDGWTHDGKSGSGSDGVRIYPAGVPTGSVLRFRFDIDQGLLEVAMNAGAWFTISNSVSGGPWRAGIATFYGDYYPEGGTANFGQSAFQYPVPNGYEPGWFGV